MKILNIIPLTTALITGCTYYQTAPGVYSTTAISSKFDQSWSAAVVAFSDQGIRITSQNRGAGVIQGTQNGIDVTGNIRTQADGSIRVQFDTTGAIERDPTLIQRISESYDYRMGR